MRLRDDRTNQESPFETRIRGYTRDPFAAEGCGPTLLLPGGSSHGMCAYDRNTITNSIKLYTVIMLEVVRVLHPRILSTKLNGAYDVR